MPRRKDQGWKAPGTRTLDEVREYERLLRLEAFEDEMPSLLPDADLGDKLLPSLQDFRAKLDTVPRSAISLTLSIESQQILAWLEKELVMKRGKCLDWVLIGFRAKYLKERKRQMLEDAAEVDIPMRRKKPRDGAAGAGADRLHEED